MVSGGLRTKGIIKQSQENKPLITIITVVRNGKKTLEQTILSVINQTYENIEYIIVDGASTDGTLDIIRKYENRIDYWMSEPDKGIYDGMNKGIGLATGDFVALLNSDDWYELNACQIIVSEINKGGGYEIYYAVARVINEKGYTLFLHGSTINNISKQSLAHQTCFVSKNIYENNKYSLKYKSASDYDFFLRLASKNIRFRFIEAIFTNYRIHGMSESFLSCLETINIKKKYNYTSFMNYIIRKIYFLIMCFIERNKM